MIQWKCVRCTSPLDERGDCATCGLGPCCCTCLDRLEEEVKEVRLSCEEALKQLENPLASPTEQIARALKTLQDAGLIPVQVAPYVGPPWWDQKAWRDWLDLMSTTEANERLALIYYTAKHALEQDKAKAREPVRVITHKASSIPAWMAGRAPVQKLAFWGEQPKPLSPGMALRESLFKALNSGAVVVASLVRTDPATGTRELIFTLHLDEEGLG